MNNLHNILSVFSTTWNVIQICLYVKSRLVFGGVELAVGCLTDAVSTGGKTAVTGRASAGGLDRRSEG